MTMTKGKETMAISGEEVKAFARERGADVVGIASVSEYHGPVDQLGSPFLVMPEAKTLISIGVAMLLGSIRSNSRIATMDSVKMYDELRRIGYDVGRFVERRGYMAATVPPTFMMTNTIETKGMVADIPHKAVAVAAGVGAIGNGDLLVTPQFGPRVRLATVVTSAPIEPDKRLDWDPCGNCHKCAAVCPVGAISPDGKGMAKPMRCFHRTEKHGMPDLIKFIEGMLVKSNAERIEAVRAPSFWDLYQVAGVGVFYDCLKCVESCPVGKRS